MAALKAASGGEGKNMSYDAKCALRTSHRPTCWWGSSSPQSCRHQPHSPVPQEHVRAKQLEKSIKVAVHLGHCGASIELVILLT